MQKNVSGQKWIVFAFNRATGAPVTGDAANITANLRQNGGGAAAITDTNPSELEAGYYAFDISQAESNADQLSIHPSSVTAKVVVIGYPPVVYTEPANQKYAATLASADVSGNLPVQVKAQDDIDFGTTQKASLNAATPSVTVSDKTGFSLSSASISAIWDQLLTAIVTVGSVGKLIKDRLDAAISSRLADGDYTTPPTVSEIRTEMDANSSKLLAINNGLVSVRVVVDAIADTSTAPVGSRAWTYHVTRSDTHESVPGALVEVYSDEGCSAAAFIQSAISNSSGIASFRLVPGVYYVLVIMPGYDMPAPDMEVVS